MARFLKDTDYSMLIRSEIKTLIANDQAKLLQAEKTAIAQVKNNLSKLYDLDFIFSQQDQERDDYIIMVIIDIALYHLYTSASQVRVPEFRSQRYEDAIKWLNNAGRGLLNADIPIKKDSKSSIRIHSRKPTNHKY